MLASGISTVIYLWKHMKRMEKNSTFFSVLRNKQQMRLTIIGIIQTVLFSIGLLWLMGEELLVDFGVFLDGGRLLRSVMALYSFGVNILLNASPWIYDISGSAIFFAMWTGFTTSLWLNVCYFFQIVPVQWPFLVWMKQHIRLIVYSALSADRLFFLSEFLFRVILEMTEIPATRFNLTSGRENITSKSNLRPNTVEIYITYLSIRGCIFVLCVVVMLASGISTVIYLWKHMKRMEKNSTFFSVLRNKQQMRLTIIGIIQTVLFSIGLLWLMGGELLVHFGVFLDGGRLLRSVMALYSLGVNILLMVGQSKYRLMANDICKKIQRLNFPFP
ncbi:uncharacterized protein LOC130234984 [Danio aesculapii]|uniref:uncharacterized protein LOC130234984 n=1 Tax=Danio aesculapii TaxID=1142201 RepID=UPI0024BF1412|nr:uncharacterized protein LOC130234984 [Danio aesculapii]